MDSLASSNLQVSAVFSCRSVVQGERLPSKGLACTCIVHFAASAGPLQARPFVYNHSSLLYSTTRVVAYYSWYSFDLCPHVECVSCVKTVHAMLAVLLRPHGCVRMVSCRRVNIIIT